MPLTMDVFNADAFTALSMTEAVERNPYMPTGLGTLDIFTPEPLTTTGLIVEELDGQLSIIQTSARGEPLASRPKDRRKARYFETPRIAKEATIHAHELQNVRAYGNTSELMSLQMRIARDVNGPTGLTSQVEYTWEHMRLGAVQGILLDADGSVIYNWFDEFGIVQPAEIDFNLDAAEPVPGALRILCNGVARSVARRSKGAFVASSRVHALCGDEFWDKFTTHPDVERTYLNQQEAAELRKGNAFGSFEFGDITWNNYRGSDDNTEIAIPSDKVKFFPVGAPGVFSRALSPAETFDFVNTPGKDIYVIPVTDKDRNAWWKAEVYSYPLFICKRPEVLLRGKLT
ncbi:major capsid protein [Zavarzinia sp.]|uniref:major capsid protein n=1 Tax=Zavarzinia sp. TaxID=2027920 RepID=UPI003BB740F2